MAAPPHIRDRISRLLLRLYPRQWRERYGDEFLALIESRGLSIAHVSDILLAAAGERVEAAISALLGSSGERWRSMRVIVRAILGRLVAAAAGTAIGLVSRVWMGGNPPPGLSASAWTPVFVITLITAIFGIACVTYLCGAAVVWVRRRHSEETGRQPSMLMSVVVMFVISIVAGRPPHAPGAASLEFINRTLGPDNMLWIVTIQMSLPRNLAPWYASRGPITRT